jgi:aminopeptidase
LKGIPMPDSMDKMICAAFNAMEFTLEFNSSDRILILTDDKSGSIAEAFKSAAFQKDCEVTQYRIKEKERPLKEIPRELSRLLTNKTIVLNIMRAFAEEISFRIKWLFEIEKTKIIKCAHMPGITEDMMKEGPINIDYREMRSTAKYLINNLQNADSLYITTDAGTDLKLGISGRTFLDDVSIKQGSMGNLPCGEIYCAPEETKATGRVVFNASIGDIGLLKESLTAEIENGKIVEFKSSNPQLVDKITNLSEIDREARIIGELGIGINPSARITGNMLEDEKAIGTAHIAFGNNEDFGGINNSKIHRDFLISKPSIEVHFKNGKTKYLMGNGKII